VERSRRTDTIYPLVAWSLVIAISFVWGWWLQSVRGHWFRVHAPPLYGHFAPRLPVFAIAAVLLAIAAVAYGPRLAELPWRVFVASSGMLAGAWGAALAAIDGVSGLRVNNRLASDFINTVPMVDSPARFVGRYVRDLASFPNHAHGHPPGLVLLQWAMSRLGMGGAGWDTALRLVAFGVAIAAVLVAVKELAGEASARRAAPFLCFAPFAAQGIAITADCVFVAFEAVGIALIVVATGRKGLRSDLMALAGGLVFGGALYSTYGALVLGLIPLVVAIDRRRLRPLIVCGAGVAIVAALFLAYGFWWVSGLRMTAVVIARGARQYRIPSYFTFANLGAFATTIGPSVAVGIARLRDRATWLLVGSALAAVALADISQLSRAEVERIWLPMAMWIGLASTSLPTAKRDRRWLALHIGFAVFVALTIRARW
jgi:methylthioxylose transferase